MISTTGDIIIIVVGQILALIVGYWLRGHVDRHVRDDWGRTLDREKRRRMAANDWLDSRHNWQPGEVRMASWAEEDEWEVRGDG